MCKFTCLLNVGRAQLFFLQSFSFRCHTFFLFSFWTPVLRRAALLRALRSRGSIPCVLLSSFCADWGVCVGLSLFLPLSSSSLITILLLSPASGSFLLSLWFQFSHLPLAVPSVPVAPPPRRSNDSCPEAPASPVVTWEGRLFIIFPLENGSDSPGSLFRR